MAGESWQEAWVEVLPDLSEFRDKANREMSGVLGAAGTTGGLLAGGNISGGILGSIKGLAVPVLGAIAALGIGQAIGDAIGSGIRYAVGSVPLASDLAETRSAIGQVFGDAGDDIGAFANDANQKLGQTRLQALQAAQTFGVFAKSAGLTGRPLSEFSTGLVTLSADLASFYNSSPQEAIDAIGAGLRGEAEPLRRFGVLLDDAVLKQRALTLGIYDGNGALSSQQRIIAAQAEIYAQAAVAQGDFARTSEGLAGQQKILEASLVDIQTKLGESLLPSATELVTFANEELVPILSDAIEESGPVLVESIRDSMPEIKELVKGAAESLPGAISAAIAVLKDVFDPEGVLGGLPKFIANPESFFEGNVDTNQVEEFFDAFQKGVEDIQRQELGQKLFESLGTAGGAQAAGAGMASNFGLGIEDEFPNVRDSWESHLEGLTDKETRDRSRAGAFGLGENFVDSLADGILGKKGRATAAAKEVADAVTAVVGKGWEIASPSKVARRQAGFFGEGLALGLEDWLPEVASMGESLAAAAMVDRESLTSTASSYASQSIARESTLATMVQAIAPAATSTPAVYVQNPFTGEYLLAQVDDRAQGAVQAYDENQRQRARGGVRRP